MGFKCPVCLKDFEKNKDEWLYHCRTEHLGAGEDIIKFIKRVEEEGKPEG